MSILKKKYLLFFRAFSLDRSYRLGVRVRLYSVNILNTFYDEHHLRQRHILYRLASRARDNDGSGEPANAGRPAVSLVPIILFSTIIVFGVWVIHGFDSDSIKHFELLHYDVYEYDVP